LEWARYGVRLNAIGPGEIRTEGMSNRLNPGEAPGSRSAKINPQGRGGQMSEVQNLATFLMADGCAWLSGQLVHMSGARYLGTAGRCGGSRDRTDDRWVEARGSSVAQNAKARSEPSD